MFGLFCLPFKVLFKLNLPCFKKTPNKHYHILQGCRPEEMQDDYLKKPLLILTN